MRLPSWKDISDGVRKGLSVLAKHTVDLTRDANGEAYVTIGGKKVEPKDEDRLDELVAADDGDIDYEYPNPDDVSDFIIPDHVEKPEEEAFLIANMQDRDITKDPTDDWIEYSMGESGRPNIQPQSNDTLPLADSSGGVLDPHEEAIYPNGGHSNKKCNIGALKEWVETVKIAGLGDDEIEEEYYHWRENEEFQQFSNVDKGMQNLVS